MDKASIEYPLHLVAQWLVFIGAVNWGAVGFFGINAVEQLIPRAVLRQVYMLVGVAAAYLIWCRFRRQV
jgi:uncharacterized membrane protein YuzA (DUF378 family)